VKPGQRNPGRSSAVAAPCFRMSCVGRRTMRALAALVVVVASCTRQGTGLPAPASSTVPPITTFSVPATTFSVPAEAPVATLTHTPTSTKPSLRLGPHSAVADIDLPEGTLQEDDGYGPHAEEWRYTVTREEMLTFLREQFATGPVYDAQGATSWRGLPPCYLGHESSSPRGVESGWATVWEWSDGLVYLQVSLTEGNYEPRHLGIIRDVVKPDNPTCLRS